MLLRAKMKVLTLWTLLIVGTKALLDEPSQNARPKPTFIVNLDTAIVICQHSASNKDLHMHDLSILCDGKLDCFSDQSSMNDENFPYCDTSCDLDCSKHGTCLLNGTQPHCYCNTGFYGTNCESYNPTLSAHANAKSKSFGVKSRSKADAFAQVKTDHKYAGEDKNVANDAFEESNLEKSEQQQKKQLKINHLAQKQSGGYILLHNPSNSTTDNSTVRLFDRKNGDNDGFEVSPRHCDLNGKGCPENAECRNGNCECLNGFEWNVLLGRCEESHFDLNGQRSEWSTIQGRRGRFQTTVYGEWKNYTGGQLIISRGKFLPHPDEWGLELTGKGLGQGVRVVEEPDSPSNNELSKSTHTANLTTNTLDSRRTNSPSTQHENSNIVIEEIQLPSHENEQINFSKKISTLRRVNSLIYNTSNQSSPTETQPNIKRIIKTSRLSKTNNGGFVALIKNQTNEVIEMHPNRLELTTSTTKKNVMEAKTPVNEAPTVDIMTSRSNQQLMTTKLANKTVNKLKVHSSTQQTTELPLASQPNGIFPSTESSTHSLPFEVSKTTANPELDEWMVQPETMEEPFDHVPKNTLTTIQSIPPTVQTTTEELIQKMTTTSDGPFLQTTTSSFDEWMVNPDEMPKELPENGVESSNMLTTIKLKLKELEAEGSTVSQEQLTAPNIEPSSKIESLSTSSPIDLPEQGLEIVVKSGERLFEMPTATDQMGSSFQTVRPTIHLINKQQSSIQASNLFESTNNLTTATPKMETKDGKFKEEHSKTTNNKITSSTKVNNFKTEVPLKTTTKTPVEVDQPGQGLEISVEREKHLFGTTVEPGVEVTSSNEKIFNTPLTEELQTTTLSTMSLEHSLEIVAKSGKFWPETLNSISTNSPDKTPTLPSKLSEFKSQNIPSKQEFEEIQKTDTTLAPEQKLVTNFEEPIREQIEVLETTQFNITTSTTEKSASEKLQTMPLNNEEVLKNTTTKNLPKQTSEFEAKSEELLTESTTKPVEIVFNAKTHSTRAPKIEDTQQPNTNSPLTNQDVNLRSSTKESPAKSTPSIENATSNISTSRTPSTKLTVTQKVTTALPTKLSEKKIDVVTQKEETLSDTTLSAKFTLPNETPTPGVPLQKIEVTQTPNNSPSTNNGVNLITSANNNKKLTTTKLAEVSRSNVVTIPLNKENKSTVIELQTKSASKKAEKLHATTLPTESIEQGLEIVAKSGEFWHEATNVHAETRLTNNVLINSGLTHTKKDIELTTQAFDLATESKEQSTVALSSAQNSKLGASTPKPTPTKSALNTHNNAMSSSTQYSPTTKSTANNIEVRTQSTTLQTSQKLEAVSKKDLHLFKTTVGPESNSTKNTQNMPNHLQSTQNTTSEVKNSSEIIKATTPSLPKQNTVIKLGETKNKATASTTKIDSNTLTLQTDVLKTEATSKIPETSTKINNAETTVREQGLGIVVKSGERFINIASKSTEHFNTPTTTSHERKTDATFSTLQSHHKLPSTPTNLPTPQVNIELEPEDVGKKLNKEGKFDEIAARNHSKSPIESTLSNTETSSIKSPTQTTDFPEAGLEIVGKPENRKPIDANTLSFENSTKLINDTTITSKPRPNNATFSIVSSTPLFEQKTEEFTSELIKIMPTSNLQSSSSTLNTTRFPPTTTSPKDQTRSLVKSLIGNSKKEFDKLPEQQINPTNIPAFSTTTPFVKIKHKVSTRVPENFDQMKSTTTANLIEVTTTFSSPKIDNNEKLELESKTEAQTSMAHLKKINTSKIHSTHSPETHNITEEPLTPTSKSFNTTNQQTSKTLPLDNNDNQALHPKLTTPKKSVTKEPTNLKSNKPIEQQQTSTNSTTISVTTPQIVTQHVNLSILPPNAETGSLSSNEIVEASTLPNLFETTKMNALTFEDQATTKIPSQNKSLTEESEHQTLPTKFTGSGQLKDSNTETPLLSKNKHVSNSTKQSKTTVQPGQTLPKSNATQQPKTLTPELLSTDTSTLSPIQTASSKPRTLTTQFELQPTSKESGLEISKIDVNDKFSNTSITHLTGQKKGHLIVKEHKTLKVERGEASKEVKSQKPTVSQSTKQPNKSEEIGLEIRGNDLPKSIKSGLEIASDNVAETLKGHFASTPNPESATKDGLTSKSTSSISKESTVSASQTSSSIPSRKAFREDLKTTKDVFTTKQATGTVQIISESVRFKLPVKEKSIAIEVPTSNEVQLTQNNIEVITQNNPSETTKIESISSTQSLATTQKVQDIQSLKTTVNPLSPISSFETAASTSATLITEDAFTSTALSSQLPEGIMTRDPWMVGEEDVSTPSSRLNGNSEGLSGIAAKNFAQTPSTLSLILLTTLETSHPGMPEGTNNPKLPDKTTESTIPKSSSQIYSSTITPSIQTTKSALLNQEVTTIEFRSLKQEINSTQLSSKATTKPTSPELHPSTSPKEVKEKTITLRTSLITQSSILTTPKVSKTKSTTNSAQSTKMSSTHSSTSTQLSTPDTSTLSSNTNKNSTITGRPTILIFTKKPKKVGVMHSTRNRKIDEEWTTTKDEADSNEAPKLLTSILTTQPELLSQTTSVRTPIRKTKKIPLQTTILSQKMTNKSAQQTTQSSITSADTEPAYTDFISTTIYPSSTKVTIQKEEQQSSTQVQQTIASKTTQKELSTTPNSVIEDHVYTDFSGEATSQPQKTNSKQTGKVNFALSDSTTNSPSRGSSESPNSSQPDRQTPSSNTSGSIIDDDREKPEVETDSTNSDNILGNGLQTKSTQDLLVAGRNQLEVKPTATKLPRTETDEVNNKLHKIEENGSHKTEVFNETISSPSDKNFGRMTEVSAPRKMPNSVLHKEEDGDFGPNTSLTTTGKIRPTPLSSESPSVEVDDTRSDLSEFDVHKSRKIEVTKESKSSGGKIEVLNPKSQTASGPNDEQNWVVPDGNKQHLRPTSSESPSIQVDETNGKQAKVTGKSTTRSGGKLGVSTPNDKTGPPDEDGLQINGKTPQYLRPTSSESPSIEVDDTDGHKIEVSSKTTHSLPTDGQTSSVPNDEQSWVISDDNTGRPTSHESSSIEINTHNGREVKVSVKSTNRSGGKIEVLAPNDKSDQTSPDPINEDGLQINGKAPRTLRPTPPNSQGVENDDTDSKTPQHLSPTSSESPSIEVDDTDGHKIKIDEHGNKVEFFSNSATTSDGKKSANKVEVKAIKKITKPKKPNSNPINEDDLQLNGKTPQTLRPTSSDSSSAETESPKVSKPNSHNDQNTKPTGKSTIPPDTKIRTSNLPNEQTNPDEQGLQISGNGPSSKTLRPTSAESPSIKVDSTETSEFKSHTKVSGKLSPTNQTPNSPKDDQTSSTPTDKDSLQIIGKTPHTLHPTSPDQPNIEVDETNSKTVEIDEHGNNIEVFSKSTISANGKKSSRIEILTGDRATNLPNKRTSPAPTDEQGLQINGNGPKSTNVEVDQNGNKLQAPNELSPLNNNSKPDTPTDSLNKPKENPEASIPNSQTSPGPLNEHGLIISAVGPSQPNSAETPNIEVDETNGENIEVKGVQKIGSSGKTTNPATKEPSDQNTAFPTPNKPNLEDKNQPSPSNKNAPNQQNSQIPLPDDKRPSNVPNNGHPTPSEAFVTAGPDEIPEAEESEITQLPQKTVHLVRNVERFHNGTLKYWSTLVPIEETSTEQTPPEFGIEITHDSSQTTAKPPSSSTNLEIGSDDVNPAQNVTREFGLVIEVATESAQTTVKNSKIKTSTPSELEIVTEGTENVELDKSNKVPKTSDSSSTPSLPVTKDEINGSTPSPKAPQPKDLSEVQQTKIGDSATSTSPTFIQPADIDQPSPTDELKAGRNEHGLVIEHIANEWPEDFETTTPAEIKTTIEVRIESTPDSVQSTQFLPKATTSAKPEEPLSETTPSLEVTPESKAPTTAPEVEIVTESSLSFQQPDEQLPKEKTSPNEEPLTSTMEPFILTASKTAPTIKETQTTSFPRITDPNMPETIDLNTLAPSIQQPSDTKAPLEIQSTTDSPKDANKPLDESQAEFPQGGESTLSIFEETNKFEQTTIATQTSTPDVTSETLQPKEIETTSSFATTELPNDELETSPQSLTPETQNPKEESTLSPVQSTSSAPEDQQTNKPIEDEDLTLKPDKVSSTEAARPETSTSNSPEETTLKANQSLTSSVRPEVQQPTSQTNAPIEASTSESTSKEAQTPKELEISSQKPEKGPSSSTEPAAKTPTPSNIQPDHNTPEIETPVTQRPESSDLLSKTAPEIPEKEQVSAQETPSKVELTQSELTTLSASSRKSVEIVTPPTSIESSPEPLPDKSSTPQIDAQAGSTILPTKENEQITTSEPTIQQSSEQPGILNSSIAPSPDDQRSTPESSSESPASQTTVQPLTETSLITQNSSESTTITSESIPESVQTPSPSAEINEENKTPKEFEPTSVTTNPVETSSESRQSSAPVNVDEIPEEPTDELKNEQIETLPTSKSPDSTTQQSVKLESTTEGEIASSEASTLASVELPLETTGQPTQTIEQSLKPDNTPSLNVTPQSIQKVTPKTTQQPATINQTPLLSNTESPVTNELPTNLPPSPTAQQSTQSPPVVSERQPGVTVPSIAPTDQDKFQPATLQPTETDSSSSPPKTEQPNAQIPDEIEDRPNKSPGQESIPSSSTAPTKASSSSLPQESTTNAPNKTPIEQSSTPQSELPKTPLNAEKAPHCVSNDECGIDAFCEKTERVCLCKKGFTGTVPACIDINECALKLDGCHPSSRCQNHIGGFTCQCPIGYRMTSTGVCMDINECAERNLTLCSPSADCLNTQGSYSCQCRQGFDGDGFTCYSDLKRLCTPAEQIISDRSRNHLCLVDMEGRIEADGCKHGYAMQYGVCIDINECSNLLTNQCSDKGVCVNTPGSYYCQCKSGYKGDGINCEDIDDCLTNPCHPQAMCTNSPGSFNCTCPSGWKGDGLYSCINPLEALCEKKSDICTSEHNANCLSMEVKKEMSTFCECAEGYRWNRTTKQCDDIDECVEKRHYCNSTTSFCVNSHGSFDCQCLDGFEGNDGICVDIDECHRNTHTCHQNAYCVNKIGTFSCACAEGFTGNGDVCTFEEEDEGKHDSPRCNEDWTSYCKSLNKTCFVDEEEVLQCGSCLNGYHLMGGKCMPLNAAGNCADPAKNDCDMNADCIDVNPGNHLCVCKNGFIGDGIRCDDVDECTMPGICDQNSICQNTMGGYKCICHPGFILQGRKCEPITEQPAKSCLQDKSLCHLNAKCAPDGSCRCASGYVGDGVSVCAPVQKQPSVPAQEQTYLNGMSPNVVTAPPSVQTTKLPSITHQQFTRIEQILTTSTAQPNKPHRMVTMPRERVTIRTTTPETHPTTTKPAGNLGNYQRPDLCKTLKCHQFAACKQNACVCNNGFIGDGFTSCTRAWEDCRTNGTICHQNAECDQQSTQCRCKSGYLGDGISCVPDRQNCQLRPGMCSEFASCIGQRCVCNAGYTGDGEMCFSLETKTSRFDCLACHCKAQCLNSECKCERGFVGNGLACVPDPYDCINYPGVCHMNGQCNNATRRCECDADHIGNGYDCARRRSCHQSSQLCHQNAECLPSGQCRCRDGYFGDGHQCEMNVPQAKEVLKPLKTEPIKCPGVCPHNSECLNGACKCLAGYVVNPNGFCIDVDECRTGAFACHASARCINSEGSYECKCPEGMLGDGKNCYRQEELQPPLKVQCSADGMQVMLGEEQKLFFVGHVYVEGQKENPHCSKTFDGQQSYPTSQNPYSFYIPVAHCNMRLENYTTLTTTVIVQKHATFITEKAYSYQVRCTYPLGTKFVDSKFGVNDLETATETAIAQKLQPTCNVAVTNLENIVVNSAPVGQVMKLALSVEPNETYAIRPRNCYAINLETSERYRLTEENGCATDTDLFPEWTQVTKFRTQAVFRLFKWPDCRLIRFECDCAPCLGQCPEVDCSRQTYRAKRHLVHLSQERVNVTDVSDQEQESNWMKNRVDGGRKTAFSSVIYVREKQESEDAQQEFEDWLIKDTKQDRISAYSIQSLLCFSDSWPLLIIVAGLVLLASASILFMFYRLKQVQNGGVHKKNLRHANSLGNLSSYIQF